MSEKIIDNQSFIEVDYSGKRLNIHKYECCSFKNCTFQESLLSSITFMECTFENCDFGLANVKSTAFKDVRFINCKLVGLKFCDCNDFLLSLYFEHCNLHFASFRELLLQGTTFRNCNLKEVDFSAADLTNSIFDNCDLDRTIFDQSKLEKVDFFTAYNYNINPQTNRIKNARFSKDGVSGLLGNYNIIIE
ncbi:MAG: pentapeptide repeat-containing protein [Saprospiraceae bacterium]|nr:pentapeptide repeat-containing protein [Saprospiraceae bacterium]